MKQCTRTQADASCLQIPIAQPSMQTKVLLFVVLLMAMFFLGTFSAEAASIYCVRADAAGANNGSDWNNAYTALPATLVRGTIYYIADGGYSGRTFNTATSGSTYITIKKATVSDHGTSTGWSDSYGDGQATFSSGLDFESSYWIFDGVTGGGPGSWSTGYGFKITETNDASAIIRTGWSANVDYITVKHVDMQGKGSVSTSGGAYSNDGLAIYGNSWTFSPSNITLSYNWLHGIGRCPIFTTMGGGNYLFEYLYISSYFASDPVHSEVISTSGVSGDMTFRNSLITDIQGTGGLMWDNHTATSAHFYIYGNVFYKPSGVSWGGSNAVIGGWTGAGSEDCRGLRVYNNSFVNINANIFGINNMYRYSDNIVENNLFYNASSPDYTIIGTHDYNHYINSGGTHSESHGTSATSGDPFVNYVALNFSLTSATSAGTTLSSPNNLDPLGNTRGADGVWDRGAFEFGGNNSSLIRPNPPILH